ncbi:hypothetical protein U9M48_005704 [Paspalum notatum var. saurae]|uniref:Protein kinase domain-containing protein n=1 Tax=Paspalum notatum var. saurae TaxID=547442 RepID=A0AAQ3PY49_PASNO
MWVGGVGITVAAVAQELAAGIDPGRIIARIQQAARTARQNKKDCERLARQVDMLPALLRRLQQEDPETMRQLAGLLGTTLVEAHHLVMSCQAKGRTYHLFHASRLATRFRDVDKKIDSYLRIFPLVSHIGLASRIDSRNSNSLPAPEMMIVRSHAAATTTPASYHDDQQEELFTLAEIKAATNNFADVVTDGDGDAAATVYKGRLRDGRQVAVKRLKKQTPAASASASASACAEDAFFREVSILAPLRHDHIVRLVGQCADDDHTGDRELIIVTQPCPTTHGGSLYDHLHGHGGGLSLSWKARVQVLLGAARAVEHLHCHAVPLVIHANLTSSTILVVGAATSTTTGVLSGFGAAVWRAAGVESQAVEVVPAAGYADPEYCATGRLKPASDVYGLGVVMLEALTGNPPVVTVWDEGRGATVPMDLASFALPAIRDGGRLLDVLDRRPPAAWQLQPLQMVADTAARCLRMHADSRPPIADVVASLEQALHSLIMSTPGRHC